MAQRPSTDTPSQSSRQPFHTPKATAVPSTPKTVEAPPKLDVSADYSTATCSVNVMPDRSHEVCVVIPADVARRVMTRANGGDPNRDIDLAKYYYENIFKPAFYSHVY